MLWTARNEAVVREARARGIWVSRADGDDSEPGDFATPAKFVQGPAVVTVSAGSAALSARLRDRLADRFDVERSPATTWRNRRGAMMPGVW